MSDDYPIRFFFGANTPDGFVGFHQTDLYDPRDGWAAFLIKSGAGTGKATFMRNIYDTLTAKGLQGEAIFCSSDPASLDAIVFRDIRLCVVDATAPHILEPVAYGECEQLVPFGCCLDPAVTLTQTAAWFDAADACAAAHRRCVRYLSAAASIFEDDRRLQREATDLHKVREAATRFVKRELADAPVARQAPVRRFLSAVTPAGPVFFEQTAAALCERVFVFEDPDGAASGAFLQEVLSQSVAVGQCPVVCPSPLAPHTHIDHLLWPSAGVCVLTHNRRHPVTLPAYRRIHAARFTDKTRLAERRERLRFGRRAADELLCEACVASRLAKHHHDTMEQLHISAMDWEQWRQIADTAKRSILRIADERRAL
ncbi:MAG: hypothetical protein IJC52_02300 [Clostridia bacterium]|nr:hypothetical protein [Clostridia bacterium]